MPERPKLLHHMGLVSFRLFCKNLGNLQEFFGQMVYRPPWPKIARTPMIIIFIPFFFSFFFLRSYNKWAKKAVVYADRANTMLRSPVAGLKIRTGQRTISGLIADLTIKLPFWRSF